jgi:asparagine synthetase B (glutamine-hydrolysing)
LASKKKPRIDSNSTNQKAGVGEDTIREFIVTTKVSDPFTISYDLQLFCVCREAEETTILSGQGSDEYFGGCATSYDSMFKLTK